MKSLQNVHPKPEKIIPLVSAAVTILIILLIMHRDYPMVGHDYAYFIPHLVDTGIHIRLHGLSIQWFTPSFGGGLPGYPNPQHMEYSIVQLVALVTAPWTAVLTSTAIIALVGYVFFFKFLNENLGLNWKASTLGAMFFIGNGFFIEHLIAGQMGYQLFPLFGVMLYLLTHPQKHYIFTAAATGIILSMMIHQAGFYLIVILFLSLGITLPLLYLYKPQVIDTKRLARIAIFALLLTAGITGSKVYATTAFLSHFPREVFDEYPVGALHGMIGMGSQLLGVMNLVPLLSLTNGDPGMPLTGILMQLTGSQYGLWETDRGLSPVLIIFLGAALLRFIHVLRRKPRLQLDRSRWIAVILLILAVWITVEFSLAKGLIYSSTKHLPILKSLHINIRFVSAFIVPLIIIGTHELHQFFLERQKALHFIASAVVTVLFLGSYFALSAPIHIRQFDASIFNGFQKDILRGKIQPVESIEDISVWQGFAPAASSIRAYEPIFGYQLEEFKPHIKLGKIFEVEDGYFNMTDPTSLVYPEINRTVSFERFKSADAEKLEIFLNRGQPDWNLPLMQKILVWVSVLTVLACITIFIKAK